MAGITLSQAEEKLAEAMAALSNALEAQEYAIGPRRKRNADLNALQRNVTFWDNQVSRLSRGGIRITGATPC